MTDATARRARRRRVLLALLIAGTVINYADRQIIALLKPLIGVDFHWTDAEYGHLASAFQLATAFGLLFAGRIVDRIGIRSANPLAVGAWSAISMAQALAHTLVQFGVLRVALGAAEALGTPVMVKSIATWFSARERSLAFGAMNAASTAGAIVTPLLVPPLAATLGWRSAFFVVGAVGLLWVLVWLLAARGVTDPGEATATVSAPLTATATATADPGSWRAALHDRRTWAIAGAKALSDQTWWFLLFWAPDLLHRFYQLNLRQTSAPLALMYCGAAAGALLGGFGARRLLERGMGLNRGRKLALLLCALLALPLAWVPSVHQEWMTVLLLALTLAAHQGFSVTLFALIADIVPATRLATVTGIGAFCGNLGGMGILAFTGWILTRQGDYGPVFLFAAASYVLALLWIHWLVPVLQPAAPPAPATP